MNHLMYVRDDQGEDGPNIVHFGAEMEDAEARLLPALEEMAVEMGQMKDIA